MRDPRGIERRRKLEQRQWIHLLWQERLGRQQPARRPGTVGIVAALVAVMPGVRQYLDDSARIIGEIVV